MLAVPAARHTRCLTPWQVPVRPHKTRCSSNASKTTPATNVSYRLSHSCHQDSPPKASVCGWCCSCQVQISQDFTYQSIQFIQPLSYLRAIFSRSTSLPSALPRECTLRMATRPCTSGLSTVTCLSKRPGRSRAWSSTSGLLVAASTITPADMVMDKRAGRQGQQGQGVRNCFLGTFQKAAVHSKVQERCATLRMRPPPCMLRMI